MENQVMIDLETMATDPSTIILTIGACVFNPVANQIFDTFYRRLDPKLQWGYRTTDPATLQWWAQQDSEALKEAFLGEGSLDRALSDFIKWYPKGCPVWSNGSNFDILIMENALEDRVPWHFRDVRDCRTMYSLAKYFNIEVKDNYFGKHNAIQDALRQADHMVQIFQALEVKR